MNESKYRTYDVIIKLIVILGSLCAFFWGIYEYRENSEREFKKPYLEMQIQTCVEISELVSSVSRIENNIKRAEKVDELSFLFFGKGALFLSDKALTEFRNFITLIQSCKTKKNINECNNNNMGVFQLNVSNACRNDLINSWENDTSMLVQEIRKYKP